MFRWNFAKSAEAMFSRWAIKRVCKFLLKKKLGKFILGDIDLNQLDVQLTAGTIQLSDLALNVEYLNQKFGAQAAVYIKEGSIGSLLVTMPWKGDGCRIEVDELELVLCPCRLNVADNGSEACCSDRDASHSDCPHTGKHDHSGVDNGVKISTLDVHEGVKTVAKMVKWLLTSFHVRVKKLIVAFDPCIEEEKNKEYCRTLVLRIAEAECGTRISEDSHARTQASADNFLELSYLANYVTFKGAVLEFLQLDGVGNQNSLSTTSETIFCQGVSECCQLDPVTPIITGKNGGFSGNFKLSIPWKNGSLDVHRVDADAYLEPLEFQCQPATIKGLICLWDLFKNMTKENRSHIINDATDSVYYGATSNYESSTLYPCVVTADKSPTVHEASISDCSSLVEKELASDALLLESHLISDWLSRSQKGKFNGEPDFDASVHQFFECFDGLRNSQSVLGSSGMWDWTCSVFSAITVATSLASESLQIPSEKQHIETNFKATVAGIYLHFSFVDEAKLRTYCINSNVNPPVQYVEAKIQDIQLVLQVCPQEMNFEATVEHIEIAHHFSFKTELPNIHLVGHNGVIQNRISSLRNLQDGIDSALPPFCSFKRRPEMDGSTKTCKGTYRNDVISVPMLETSSASHCQVRVSSASSNDLSTGPISFSLKLPVFMFWMDIDFIRAVLDLLKEMGSFYDTITSCSAEAMGGNYKQTTQGDKRKTSSGAISSLTKETMRGDILFSGGRIILCFPYEEWLDFWTSSSCRMFIAIDLSRQTKIGDEMVEASKVRPVASFKERYPMSRSHSLHFNLGSVVAYLITSASEEIAESEPGSKDKKQFIAHKILSVADGADTCPSVISMLWQTDPLTGPWIAKRAKYFASAENIRSREGLNRKGHNLASVTTIKDMEDFDSRTRQEMIVSSKVFVYAHQSLVTVNLCTSTYENLHHLILKSLDYLQCMEFDISDVAEESNLSQESILVECDSLEISVSMKVVESVKGSIQSELPGSWHTLRLQVRKFELLSVTALGGIKGGSFLWASHGEGDLWGSITGAPGQEFILISCSDPAVGRGAGEGSNVFSSRCSGSDIIHMWDSENLHNSMSVSVRGGTIVAVGGRLDWLDALCSFFTSSPEKEVDDKVQKDASNMPSGSSFVLNLVDIALSYEPYLDSSVSSEGSDAEFICDDVCGNSNQNVACLLAASSLCLSSSISAGSSPAGYRIRAQDLGLLLSEASGVKRSCSYGAEYLRKTRYVKVAQDAHVEALLRTNCNNGCDWEVECCDSHLVINTCHDTASGLIQLGAQLQRIFAPDIEESAVHLQNRWNVQQAHVANDRRMYYDDCGPSASQSQASGVDISSNSITGNLVDDILEDAFKLSGTCADSPPDSSFHFLLSDNYLDEPCSVNYRDSDDFVGGLPITGSSAVTEIGYSSSSMSQENIPELIEEYFLSDLRPLSDLRSQSSHEVLTSKADSLNRGTSGWYGSSVKILEDHVSESSKQETLQLNLDHEPSRNDIIADGFGKIKGRILLKNINVVYRMFGGSDWHNSDQKTIQHSASSHGRNTTICLELSLSGLECKYDVLPDGGLYVCRLSLSIQDFCINDNSKNAAWKLVLGYYQSKNRPRRSLSKAFKLELDTIRPEPATPLEEYRLRISLLPLRLHLHQSQLDFFISFFGGKSTSEHVLQNATQELGNSGNLSTEISNLGNLFLHEEALLPYFQKLEVSPLMIRVDYSPCHVDLAALRGGKYVELVNLVPWKGIELQLRRVQAVGIYGWNRVFETIIGEWLEDISQNQVHELLKGLPPIRSLVAVGSGAAKLVTLPVKNYKKEQRLVKGMQRGTIAFLRSISLEAIGLGVHLAAGAHEILLQAEYILTTIPPSVPWPAQSRVNSNVRSNQPNDARQGIWQAYKSISDGLSKSASALVQTPLKKYQRGSGVGSALATAVQAAPAAAIAPASAAARAMHCAFLGVRNSLDPEHKKESLGKYLGATQPQEFMD